MTRQLLVLIIAIATTIIITVTYKMSVEEYSTNFDIPRARYKEHNYEIVDAPPCDPPYSPTVKINTGNIPDVYFNDSLKRPKNFNSSCAPFPLFFDNMRFTNDYWQVQQTTKGTFHLFNAYVDRRNGTVVQIVGTYDVLKPTVKFYCQLWFYGKDKPVIVETSEMFWLFRSKWGADNGYFHHPYIISCPYNGTDVPMSVSLVEKPCQKPTNNLKVFHKTVDEKKNFVVCVKGLSFPFEDKSARLAEWIELVSLLGAEKINFYEFEVHPNIQKVLDYYVDLGFVEVTPITLAGDSTNIPLLQNLFLHKKITPRRLQEVITFNDCLYKHLDEFKYVVLLDTDEVIVPVNGTWIELAEALEKLNAGINSFMARNVYFLDQHLHQHPYFDDIPRYMHMLQHVDRARNYTKPGYFVKGFHNTSRVAALHNHFPLKCLDGCTNREIDVKLAHLQHYRADCASGAASCDEMKKDSVVDKRVWKFKDELIERVQRTLSVLGLAGGS